MSDRNDTPSADWRVYADQLTASQRRMCERSEGEDRLNELGLDVAAMARDFVADNDFQHQCDAVRASLDVPAVTLVNDATEWFSPDGDHPMTWRDLMLHRCEIGGIRAEVTLTELLDGTVSNARIQIDMPESRDWADLDASQARDLAAHLVDLAVSCERGER